MKDSPDFNALRARMVSEHIKGADITDEGVLAAMSKVPRHLFVPEKMRNKAYENCPLPIGPDETISQPYIIAVMLEILELQKSDKVLEIGTGSGYEAALLCELASEVFSIEIDEKRHSEAKMVLTSLTYENITLLNGDGYKGWPEMGPFDAIIVSAAPENIPRELVRQLKVGGRMVLPLGVEDQELIYIEKNEDGLVSREIGGVKFVPMKAGA